MRRPDEEMPPHGDRDEIAAQFGGDQRQRAPHTLAQAGCGKQRIGGARRDQHDDNADGQQRDSGHRKHKKAQGWKQCAFLT
jgi:hypothetical protein